MHYLVIPDLHGQITLLKKALNGVRDIVEKSTAPLTLVFLGDYIDRGESGSHAGSYYRDAGSLLVFLELLELEREMEKSGIPVVFLKGNHEAIFESYFRFGLNEAMQYDFFPPTVEVFEKNGQVDSFLEFIDRCKLFYKDEAQRLFFVHAGIDPSAPAPELSSEESLLWIRQRFFDHKESFPYTVIFGHTPFSSPLWKKDRIGLDGGACYSHPGYGKLHLLHLAHGQRSLKVFERTLSKTGF